MNAKTKNNVENDGEFVKYTDYESLETQLKKTNILLSDSVGYLRHIQTFGSMELERKINNHLAHPYI